VALALPGVGHQAQVVIHQLVTGAQGTATHGLGCVAWTSGVLLPALHAPGELQNSALAQRLTAGAVIDPASDGRARGGGTVGHGEGRNCVEHSPWFHPCAVRWSWVMAMASSPGDVAGARVGARAGR
jgi:hypothetical protein